MPTFEALEFYRDYCNTELSQGRDILTFSEWKQLENIETITTEV